MKSMIYSKTKLYESKTEFLRVPYTHTINKAIRKTFDPSNYKLSYKTKNRPNSSHLIVKSTKKESSKE